MKKPNNAILASLFLLTLFSATPGIYNQVSAAPAQPESKTASQKLRRADFRVTGASCVACLRRIGKTIREQKGVLKGDVSIFKPYWAIVIYDAGQTNLNNLRKCVAKERVKFEDIEDRPIASLPAIVIPRNLNTKAESTPSGGSHTEIH